MAINTEVAKIALDRVEGSTFERFINDFYPGIAGASFVPLGGVGDGGADAFGGDPVYEREGRASSFYQASVQEDFRAKIRQTIKRLREFGRHPKSLTYLTARTIRHIDVEEESLSSECDATIRIRDGAYIASQINTDKSTRAAFDQHLRPLTEFLQHVGASKIVTASKHVSSPAVYVFLRQELDRRAGNAKLVESVVESLILWALEGTDPDAGVFMTAGEIEGKILSQVTSAAPIITGKIRGRLESMSTKGRPEGRKVNWHRPIDSFCLPYHARQTIERENVEDEALRLEVLNGFYGRVSRDYPHLSEKDLRRLAEVTMRAFQIAFENEGLELSHFISQEVPIEYPTMADAVREALTDSGITGANAVRVAPACLAAVRGCLYDSTPQERDYLGRLARTYALLFTLNTEPRLVQYFQDMAADFHLYVGTDLLIRAMSERYLPEADQLTRNALIFAARSGSRLVLAEPVLEEVISHLRASDFEFKNHVQAIEHRYTILMASNVPKILVRSYLYAKLDPLRETDGPGSWPDFVEKFVDYSSLHQGEAEEQLKRYLQFHFSMEYQSRDSLRDLVRAEDVDNITEELLSVKADRRLAENDALLACAVYGRRRREREDSKVTEFGYNTWWLTMETAILRYTRSLEQENGGARYIMRPDFLLNFLTFAPSGAEARKMFGNIFPSLLGIQLSRRIDEDTFHGIMAEVARAEKLDPARRNAAIAAAADKLKSDFDKRYTVEMGGSPAERMTRRVRKSY